MIEQGSRDRQNVVTACCLSDKKNLALTFFFVYRTYAFEFIFPIDWRLSASISG